ncbi:MAG: hypothetical protein V2B19_15765 [Pseudomonadota bacterium]
MDAYRDRLAPQRGSIDNAAFTDLVCRAVALGFKDKWNERSPASVVSLQKVETCD